MARKGKKNRKPAGPPTIKNARARHLYHIEDTLEAGMVLLGSEVKSLREGQASLPDSFAYIKRGEVWLVKAHIAPYAYSHQLNHDPLRKRKLLLHKREIAKLQKALAQDGYTLVPLEIYFNDRGVAKCRLGLARGKRQYDKRESIKKRDAQREIQRTLRAKGRR